MHYPAWSKKLALQIPLYRRLVAERDSLQANLQSLEIERGYLQAELESLNTEIQIFRDDASKAITLLPKFVAQNQNEFFDGFTSREFHEIRDRESPFISDKQLHTFYLKQFCLCCNKSTDMLVDYEYAHKNNDGLFVPNWRERLVCPGCGMNNRQRLIAKLTQQHIFKNNNCSIYFMEQITPIYNWIRTKFPRLNIYGSEYLGYDYQGGELYNGIRHEDVMNLSFQDNSFDLIISNDVFEHVPNPFVAFKECFRTLTHRGTLLATIPFHSAQANSTARAELKNNELIHLLPPQYHGNPLSPDGCLVFHDFGWDIMSDFRNAGFGEHCLEIYHDDKYGHWGEGLLIFRLEK